MLGLSSTCVMCEWRIHFWLQHKKDRKTVQYASHFLLLVISWSSYMDYRCEINSTSLFTQAGWLYNKHVKNKGHDGKQTHMKGNQINRLNIRCSRQIMKSINTWIVKMKQRTCETLRESGTDYSLNLSKLLTTVHFVNSLT